MSKQLRLGVRPRQSRGTGCSGKLLFVEAGSRRGGRALPLLIAGAMAGFWLLSGCARQPAQAPTAQHGLEQPSVEPVEPVTLADLSGKVVLVDFWGPWCPPCRLELPHIAALGEKYSSQPDFRLLAISCGRRAPEDIEELRQQTEEFLAEVHLDLPTYADPDAVTRSAFDSVGELVGFPTTFLLDRQGVIRNVWVGFDPRDNKQIEQMDGWIAYLLQEQSGAPADQKPPAPLQAPDHPAAGQRLPELKVVLLTGQHKPVSP